MIRETRWPHSFPTLCTGRYTRPMCVCYNRPNVVAGSRIISDSWPMYVAILQLRNGIYEHSAVKHQLHFVDPLDDTVHTQNIEGLWMHAKRKLRRQSGTSRALFPTYLAEFVWRRWVAQQSDAFSAFIAAVAGEYPV